MYTIYNIDWLLRWNEARLLWHEINPQHSINMRDI
jgi:hypothetical protein